MAITLITMIEAMDNLKMAPPLQVELIAGKYEELGMIPWFSYSVDVPQEPLPTLSQRRHLQTEHLIIRPLLPSDVDSFGALRSNTDLQTKSTARGRPDRDIDESRQNLDKLQPPHDENHWYFGVFHAETGELIGEAGMPSIEGHPRSGWPEFEVLILPEHQRKAYGTEVFSAIMDSWWKLPRERRRRQLHPVVVMPGLEPGDRVVDGIGIAWEYSNTVANHFFAKVLGQSLVSHTGTFEDWDQREGRVGNLVRWAGSLAVNPNPRIDDGDT